MSGRTRAMICLLVMLLAPLAPALSPASAQTNPPTGSGDWSIPASTTTTITANASNNGQILMQGNIHVYGDLILEGMKGGHHSVLSSKRNFLL